MIKKIKNILLAVMLPIAMAAPALALPAAVHAEPIGTCGDIKSSLQQGTNAASVNNAGNGAQCGIGTTDGSANSLSGIASKIVNFLSVLVGIVAVIMIIVGGFRYITSGGDSSKVGGAKNTLIYAIVGLIIVALAQFIVRFVLNNATIS